MRRLSVAVLGLLLLLAPLAVESQQVPSRAGGILDLVSASVSVTNTTTAGTLYSRTIPPNLFSNFAPPIIGTGALHLRLLGQLTTNQGVGSVGSLNVGCNIGGANATIALVNAFTLPSGLSATPITLDVWVTNVNPAPSLPGAQLIMGRLAFMPGIVGFGATEAVLNAAFVGNVDEAINETLTCAWMWGSAASTNSVVFWNGLLHVGM